jgi:hypothetical protein
MATVEELSAELERVRRASLARRLAETEYRVSLRLARAAGASYSQLGRAAGLTKQGARKLVAAKTTNEKE